jgi:hypothetical protein
LGEQKEAKAKEDKEEGPGTRARKALSQHGNEKKNGETGGLHDKSLGLAAAIFDEKIGDENGKANAKAEEDKEPGKTELIVFCYRAMGKACLGTRRREKRTESKADSSLLLLVNFPRKPHEV